MCAYELNALPCNNYLIVRKCSYVINNGTLEIMHYACPLTFFCIQPTRMSPIIALKLKEKKGSSEFRNSYFHLLQF